MAQECTNTVVGPMIGPQFLSAVAKRDFVSLASCFSDSARFRALLPRGLREATGGSESAGYFQQWFGLADRIELLDSAESAIVDKRHLSWRLRVHDSLGRRLVEQQAYATVRDGQIIEFDLLCSGFRAEDVPAASGTPTIEDSEIAVADVLAGGDANCATLTPLIKAKLRELSSGQVLEVVTDEPTAEQDIKSWSGLTGNPLIGMRVAGTEKHFYVRKK